MIRVYAQGDERRMKPNEYSDIDACAPVFEDRAFEKFTLEHLGIVEAIICFKPYWEDNYIGFLLISDDMPVICARELHDFVHRSFKGIGMKRLQTDSMDCAVLNRWHEFVGFTLEGTRRAFMNGKDFNMWGMVA